MYARELWRRLETLHAVTYFAEESISAARTAGLKGFWMGYFGFRAAPLGRVSAAVVEATFANFAPGMIARSIPEAWDFSDPEHLLAARVGAAADALRRLAPELAGLPQQVTKFLERIVDGGSVVGRPLFAANARLELPDDPVGRLWQLATSLREHRGDGHVQALAMANLDGCEVHHLHAAEFGTPAEVLRDNRGWTDDEWRAAAAQLDERGLLRDGVLTAAGAELRREIESETDRLAMQPIAAGLDEDERTLLVDALTSPARQVAASGEIPFPNPIGLDRLSL